MDIGWTSMTSRPFHSWLACTKLERYGSANLRGGFERIRSDLIRRSNDVRRQAELYSNRIHVGPATTLRNSERKSWKTEFLASQLLNSTDLRQHVTRQWLHLCTDLYRCPRTVRPKSLKCCYIASSMDSKFGFRRPDAPRFQPVACSSHRSD
jgi:hypothetical protein